MTRMATSPQDIRLFTVDTVPVAEYLGAVRAWWRDPDFETAETLAFETLVQQAAAMGADAVVGVRVETTQELQIHSPTRLRGTFTESEATTRVYVTGTAVVLIAS